MPRLSRKARQRREMEALVKAHLARASDRILSARIAMDVHGISERLEIEILSAMSELDLAEKANRWWTNAKLLREK